MTSHNTPRQTQSRTEAQYAAEQIKIQTYTNLQSSLLSHISTSGYTYTPEAFALTTRILRLNPEYYTVWNVRRRLLADGLLSKRSSGSSPSTVLPTTSATSDTLDSSDSSSSYQKGGETPASRQSLGTEKGGGSGLPLEKPQQEAAAEERSKAQQNDQKVLTDELQFTIPLLLASPKCYWIWNYRRHILSESISRLPTPIARGIWLQELGLDSQMLTRDRRNFHAWGYRRYVVAMLESKELDGKSMVEEEFKFTMDKIKGDLSNFSAWHSRSKLIPRLLDERQSGSKERRSFLDEELALVNDALDVGPEDQSLWFYHQFLMASFTPGNEEYAIVTDYSASERIDHLSQQIAKIKDLAEDYGNVKWIYEALVEYTVTLGQLRELEGEEERDLGKWLGRLRELDPMRQGRWDDLEASWHL